MKASVCSGIVAVDTALCFSHQNSLPMRTWSTESSTFHDPPLDFDACHCHANRIADQRG
jgi:hypothetical protein